MFKEGDRVVYNGKFDSMHENNFGEWMGMDVVGKGGSVVFVREPDEAGVEVVGVRLDGVSYYQTVHPENLTLVETTL